MRPVSYRLWNLNAADDCSWVQVDNKRRRVTVQSSSLCQQSAPTFISRPDWPAKRQVYVHYITSICNEVYFIEQCAFKYPSKMSVLSIKCGLVPYYFESSNGFWSFIPRPWINARLFPNHSRLSVICSSFKVVSINAVVGLCIRIDQVSWVAHYFVGIWSKFMHVFLMYKA